LLYNKGMDPKNYTKEEMLALADSLESQGYTVYSDLIYDAAEDGFLENGLRGSIGSADLIASFNLFNSAIIQTMNVPEEELPLYISINGIEAVIAYWRLKLEQPPI